MNSSAKAAAIVANGIRALREHRGLTQRGLAARMGVSQSLVSRWEDAHYRGWTCQTLIKIAQALNARLRVEFKD